MSKGKFALGALFGAVAGFVAGVLTAPKSGKETRADIKNAANKTKDVVAEEAGKFKDTATRKGEELKTKVGDVYEDVVEKGEEYRARTEQAVEGARKGFAKKPNKK